MVNSIISSSLPPEAILPCLEPVACECARPLQTHTCRKIQGVGDAKDGCHWGPKTGLYGSLGRIGTIQQNIIKTHDHLKIFTQIHVPVIFPPISLRVCTRTGEQLPVDLSDTNGNYIYSPSGWITKTVHIDTSIIIDHNTHRRYTNKSLVHLINLIAYPIRFASRWFNHVFSPPGASHGICARFQQVHGTSCNENSTKSPWCASITELEESLIHDGCISLVQALWFLINDVKWWLMTINDYQLWTSVDDGC